MIVDPWKVQQEMREAAKRPHAKGYAPTPEELASLEAELEDPPRETAVTWTLLHRVE